MSTANSALALPGAQEHIHSLLPADQLPPYEPGPLPQGYTWREEKVYWHGHPGTDDQGNQEEVNSFTVDFVYPGRRVVQGTWPASRPEFCEVFSGPGQRLADSQGEVLICPGCGLDCG
ncbi:hypothetical protein KGD82_27920 (plasmid) [Nocardiopsis eucommiae]|uniref:Uncharacterized protein n=1 Tax=Nocardiopsis eucommiae TaxID=2831970 RepID=A0A975LCX7_9ACTN|nr:hypothetical protein KGD82_27920 [Nocardiopsis eucommiae]